GRADDQALEIAALGQAIQDLVEFGDDGGGELVHLLAGQVEGEDADAVLGVEVERAHDNVLSGLSSCVLRPASCGASLVGSSVLRKSPSNACTNRRRRIFACADAGRRTQDAGRI